MSPSAGFNMDTFFSWRHRAYCDRCGRCVGVRVREPVGRCRFGRRQWLSLWLVSGATFLSLVIKNIRHRENADDVFLGLWFLLFCLMMGVVMPWSAARYCLIAVPAVVFIKIRFYAEGTLLHARSG